MNNEILTELRNNQNSMKFQQDYMQLQQESIKLQQDFLRNQGKKGFKFRNNPDNYPTLVIKYIEKINSNMLDTEKFALL